MDGLAIPAKTIRAVQRQEESKQAFVLQRKTKRRSSLRAAQHEHSHILGTMLPFFYDLIYSSFFNITQPTTHNRGCECKVGFKMAAACCKAIENMSGSSFLDGTRTSAIDIPDNLFTLTTESSHIRCLAEIMDSSTFYKRWLKGQRTRQFQFKPLRTFNFQISRRLGRLIFPKPWAKSVAWKK